ncbi:MAG: pentapeptide repeat-containing protein [Fimbriimonas sp.]
MSLQPWTEDAKEVTVERRGDGSLLVRPHRLETHSGIVLGTSLGVAVAVSGALVYAQMNGWPGGGAIVLSLIISLVIGGLPALQFAAHPERWRLFAWWLGAVVAKLPFADTPLFMFPVELLVIVPASLQASASANLKALSLTGVSLRGADIGFVQFLDSDLSGADLTGAVLRDVRFERCQLRALQATDAQFSACTFVDCGFQEASLDRTAWHGSDAREADFSGASLVEAEFAQTNLRKANFAETDLRGARFPSGGGKGGTRMEGATLRGSRYDAQTVWAIDVLPTRGGAIKVDESARRDQNKA